MSLYAGVMSGTSLDGIDVAFADIDVLDASPIQPRFAARFVAQGASPYPPDLRARVERLRQGEAFPIAETCRLHYELGNVYAEAVRQSADDNGIRLTELAGIGLHGQTVWHAPPSSGAAIPSTLQLGQPAVLAETLGVPIVSDFRARDLAAGGEGAPLVPFADYALFASLEETRVALNLGGIANITYLPAGGALTDIIAFDTGPGNLIMDGLAKSLTGELFDAGGALAAQGTVDETLLAELLSHLYFALPPPKSTGAEMFSARYAADLRERGARLSPADLMATAAQLTVQTIAQALRDFLPQRPDRLIAAGGGVRNKSLMTRLCDTLPGIPLDSTEAFGIPPDARESLAFALLAAATLHHIPANVPTATGATGPRLLGSVTYP